LSFFGLTRRPSSNVYVHCIRSWFSFLLPLRIGADTTLVSDAVKIDQGEKCGRLKACIHPINESLVESENMKGKYHPKEAFLWMKQDLEDGNPQMWDLTAYRTLDTPHYRTHDK
jgi:hypothetical protein